MAFANFSTSLFFTAVITFFFFTLSQSRALRRDLDSLAGNVFPFSHDAPGGDVAHLLALSERLLAFLPWGEEGWWGGVGGLTEEMSLYLSLSVTQTRGRATNGLFFQSFLAPAVFLFFICVLGNFSFIHVPSFLLSLFLARPPIFSSSFYSA